MNTISSDNVIKDDKRVVLYSIDTFLDITANWIYSQMIHLGKFKPAVVCSKRANQTCFPYRPVFSLSDLSLFQRIYNKTLRNLTRRSCYKLFYDVVSSLGPVLIHSHFGMRGYADLEIKRRYGLPLITSFYGMDATMVPKQDPRWLERYRKLFLMGDLFLVEAPNMKNILVDCGCDPGKITVQSLGIEVGAIGFRERLRKQQLKILIASSFREKKGIPDSLAAVGRIKQELGEFSITIIGGAVDLPGSRLEEHKIKEVIAKHALDKNVIFKGFMTHAEMMDEAYKHDIFLATSKTAQSGDSEGGTNIVLLEMGATGLPVLATDHCDLRLTMGELNRRYLAEEGSVESIIEALRGLLRADWGAIGRDNRAHVAECYNIERQRRSLEAIYESCLEK